MARGKRTALVVTPKQLDPADLQILALKMKYPGLTLEQIGQFLGISKQAVSHRLKNQRFKDLWGDFEKDVIERIRGLRGEAVQVYEKCLKSKDERLAYLAAKDILQKVLESPQLAPEQVVVPELNFVHLED